MPMVRNVAAAFAEYSRFFALGTDGMFSDFSNEAFDARAMYAADQTYVIEDALTPTGGSPLFLRSGSRDATTIALANLKSTPLKRTDDVLKAWSTAQSSPTTLGVCRYFDADNSRHLYSIESTQCASFATADYGNEGIAFHVAPAGATGVCSADTVAVSRYTRTANGVTFEPHSAVTDAKFAAFTRVTAPAFCVPK